MTTTVKPSSASLVEESKACTLAGRSSSAALVPFFALVARCSSAVMVFDAGLEGVALLSVAFASFALDSDFCSLGLLSLGFSSFALDSDFGSLVLGSLTLGSFCADVALGSADLISDCASGGGAAAASPNCSLSLAACDNGSTAFTSGLALAASSGFSASICALPPTTECTSNLILVDPSDLAAEARFCADSIVTCTESTPDGEITMKTCGEVLIFGAMFC